jgi:hypothetical protein
MDSLARVKRVGKRRATVMQEYRAAIRAAREDGHSLRTIADAAGVSHVAVLKVLKADH